MTAVVDHPTSIAPTQLAPLSRAVYVIAGIKTAFFLAIAGVWGIHRDEFYYLAAGRRLDWGYVDHPILTPLLYRIDVTLFGDSQYGLHVLPALIAGVTVIVAVFLARELGGGRFAQVLTALSVAVAPFFVGTGHFLSTVSVDILMWSIGMLLLARLLRTRDQRLWLAIGLVGGIGLLNKNTMAFWAIGVVGGLLLARDWAMLRSRWFFAGIGLSIAMQVPYLLWQTHHDWPTIEFLRSLQSHDDLVSNPLAYFPLQVLLLGPALAWVWIPGVRWLLREEKTRPYRALAFGYLVVLVLLFVLRGKAYYVASWYPALFAAGAVRLESVSRWSLRKWCTVILATGLPAVFFAVPVVPSSSSLAEVAVSQDVELGEMLGWHDMAQQVADVAHSLPIDEQTRLTILTENYSEAGAIEFWRSSLHVPQPISRQNSYWIWGYGAAPDDGTVIAVGFARSELEPFFTDIELAGNVTNDEAIHNKEFGAEIVICRGQRVPWSQMWPLIKQFN